LSGLRAFAEQSRSLGYEGMMAIPPSHIPVINEAFTLALPPPRQSSSYRRARPAPTAQRRVAGRG